MTTEKLSNENKLELIKKFEALKTMYDNSNVHCSFQDYALEHWDKVNVDYLEDLI